MANDFNLTAPRCLIGLWSEERELLSENYVARVTGKADKVDTFERVMPRCRQGKGRWVSSAAQAGIDVMAPAHAPAPPPRAVLLERSVEAEAAAYVASLAPAPEAYERKSMASLQFTAPADDAISLSQSIASARAASRHVGEAPLHARAPACSPSPSADVISRLPSSLQSRESQLILAPVASRIVARLSAAGLGLVHIASMARDLNPTACEEAKRNAARLIPPGKADIPTGSDVVLARCIRDAARAVCPALADSDIEAAIRACQPRRVASRAADDVSEMWVSLSVFEALEGLATTLP